MGRGWGEEAAVGRASKHLATHVGIFRNSCQVRNMCYVGKLVILHHLYMFGNLSTGVQGIIVEQRQKNTKSDLKSTCLIRRAFYPGTQMRPSVMKSTSPSELQQYSCASLHFVIYKMIFSHFVVK